VIAGGLGLAGVFGSDDAATPTGVVGTDALVTSTILPTSTAPPAIEAEVCAPLDDHEMALSSSIVANGVVSNEWNRTFQAQNNYPTPAFEISGVPEGTTELAIVITDATRDSDAVLADPQNADYRSFTPLWIATGVPADTTKVPSGNAFSIPSGITTRKSSGDANLGGTIRDDVFTSLDSGGVMLFTVVAMCNPPIDYWDTARLGWFDGAIAHRSFAATLAGP
jgi:hypothetical protein